MNHSKIMAVIGMALTALITPYFYQKWLNKLNTSKKKLSTPLQVWEGEGGNVPEVPTPHTDQVEKGAPPPLI